MFWKLQENVITERELDLLISFIKETKRFTQFTKVAEFEKAFARWQGSGYSVFVNSGSSANLVMVSSAKEYYEWRDGDEIIVPTVTWPTTITPVMQCGLTPVFVDANLTDLSLDYDQVHSAITPRTRGIFVAHLLGFPSDVARLKEIVSGRDITILEDCCESQGATLKGTKVGRLGAAGTFSFYWGHHMTTVEGGMLCTDDEELYKLFLLKRSHGLARELPEHYYAGLKERYRDIDFNFLFLTDGFNVRNTEFNAVLGLEQLKRMNSYIMTRNANYRRFVDICRRFSDHLIVLDVKGMSSFVLPFLFREGGEKSAFQKLIAEEGIESRPLISGNLLRQPFLRAFRDQKTYPNADFLHENAFYIGNNQFVGEERLAVLESIMENFFGQNVRHEERPIRQRARA
ncbi:MAG TPA: DegT/DnrJ/EryC1/StrS aminotransferase family protein [Syntrophorhabdaceae bacterium]|jgi:CDP-6-deoxy-D-xylo-4-hexulose-3-dehydrase